MRIIVDAMGGDHAPNAIVMGAVDASKELDCEIILVGIGEKILQALKDNGLETLPKGIEIAHASDVVDMHDEPSSVMKKRKDSSMVVGLQMLADGQGDAFISAGSTGALLSAATLLVKRVRGIRRAAMGPVVPTAKGGCILIDCGANAECTAEFLLQFGYMGSFYAQKMLHIDRPKVGLLNIGGEDSKGTALQKEAYALLKAAGDAGDLHFVGNVEARDVPLGAVDVVVADGFSGNVLLKGIEGTAKLMSGMMKDMFQKSFGSKIGYLLCKQGVDEIKEKLDYRHTGGTPLIGIAKPVIKAHGSSDAVAVKSAVRQAVQVVQSNVTEAIKDNIDKMVLAKE